MAQTRCFELRTYTAHPGKLEPLHTRFRDHTCRLFARHGIEVVGFWRPVEGAAAQSQLVYLLAFPSREAREAAWSSFRSDPEWVAVRDESHRDGELTARIESVLLSPTDYSPLK